MPLWLVGLLALLYVLVLFAIAWQGDRREQTLGPARRQLIYALSLGVYCSSWSFLGTVGQSAQSIWSYLPVFIAPILVMALGFGTLQKLVRVSHRHRITSLADFLGARYGKSRLVAATVTLIALLACLPYIALQLKAMVLSLDILSGQQQLPGSTAPVVAAFLALFAILFGTRKLDATEHHPGLMLAMAFESGLKLMALLVVTLVVIYGSFDGLGELISLAVTEQVVRSDALSSLPALLAQSLVGVFAFFCLPRQFHVMVVENQSEGDLRQARWLFPLYLVLIALPVAPLALAGGLIFQGHLAADTYVISLPLLEGHPWVALLAVLGAISAATGMVIVATVTIATMVSNELLVPYLLKTKRLEGRNFEHFARQLLHLRRAVILLLLLLALIVYWHMGNGQALAAMGLLAFGAFAQLGPALLGGLHWQGGNRKGALLGLAAGFGSWWWLHDWLLGPYAILLSLLINGVVYGLGSLLLRAGVIDRLQAASFVASGQEQQRQGGAISLADLQALASRFVGPVRVAAAIERHARAQGCSGAELPRQASAELMEDIERLMASVIGAASAALVMRSAVQGRDIALDEVVTLVDEATEQLQFSRELLQGAIENASEGISVVDRHLNLVAWNRRYLALFDYPPGLIQVGRPVAQLIRFNAERGWCGPGAVEDHVARRVNHMRQGSAHSSERERPDGSVIKVQGNPMPGGGFVMTFTDITVYRRAERLLKAANEELELRVAERTMELSAAKAEADRANQSKSRFLAACGHDLMQPLNAARLFTSALLQQGGNDQALLENIKSSLKSAGDLLTDLLDISKLDAGTLNVNRSTFDLKAMLDSLAGEFAILAREQGVILDCRLRALSVASDRLLLRRIIQNFLANAIRYGKGGRVLLSARRRGKAVLIQVWDTGPGIAPEQQEAIFEEFRRLDRDEKGLGLGLAIAQRMGRILGHPLSLRSVPGRGSVFGVLVPLAEAPARPASTPRFGPSHLGNPRVLCLDNDESILAAMAALLEGWGCTVLTARNRREALALADDKLDMMLADYHLDGGDDGLAVMAAVRKQLGRALAGVLITADSRQELIEQAREAGFGYMAKMVKPAALRALMIRQLGSATAVQ
ncbi:PAS domain-containing hybrid sensor histidine kinase/response regulator [Gallaecimonas sp. GXIMD4217]|uniref:hybrid sensor histidine kinase/response regulator n=1 Tax=Gallaecimonas sp. GXIMD4217 TaxID=3131927 RepID=UPI00311AFBA8